MIQREIRMSILNLGIFFIFWEIGCFIESHFSLNFTHCWTMAWGVLVYHISYNIADFFTED